MSVFARRGVSLACCVLLGMSLLAIADDDKDKDKDDDAALQAAQPGLTGEQQRAVGIVVAHPVPAKAPKRIEALGLVLDETALISDLGDASAAAATMRSTSTASKFRGESWERCGKPPSCRAWVF